MKSTLKMFLVKLDRVVAGYSNIIRTNKGGTANYSPLYIV